MKYRIISFLAVSTMICAATAGCSGSSSSESGSTVSQTTQTASSETTAAPSNDETTQDFSAPKEKKLYDNEEIYSNIYLLGRQLFSPLTVGDLGDDFDFTDSWGSSYFEDWMCAAKYKGKKLNSCSFILENCSALEEIKDSTIIKAIYVDSDDKVDSDEPIISVYGITVGDTRDDVCQKIGAPSRTLETSMSLTDDYRGDYGETLVSFEYSEPDFKQIKQIIVFLQ